MIIYLLQRNGFSKTAETLNNVFYVAYITLCSMRSKKVELADLHVSLFLLDL